MTDDEAPAGVARKRAEVAFYNSQAVPRDPWRDADRPTVPVIGKLQAGGEVEMMERPKG